MNQAGSMGEKEEAWMRMRRQQNDENEETGRLQKEGKKANDGNEKAAE